MPIISGGSMLYVERSIKGLDPSPNPDKRLRESLGSMIEDGDQDAVVEYVENFHLEIDINDIMVNRRRALRLLEKMILPNDGEPLPPIDKNFLSWYVLCLHWSLLRAHWCFVARLFGLVLRLAGTPQPPGAIHLFYSSK